MNEPFEPIDGARVRIKVEVDGRLLLDADLTTVYLRTKYGADDTLMPFHFVPFAPPDDEGEDNDAPAPAPLQGRLRFTLDKPAEPGDGVRAWFRASGEDPAEPAYTRPGPGYAGPAL